MHKKPLFSDFQLFEQSRAGKSVKKIKNSSIWGRAPCYHLSNHTISRRVYADSLKRYFKRNSKEDNKNIVKIDETIFQELAVKNQWQEKKLLYDPGIILTVIKNVNIFLW